MIKGTSTFRLKHDLYCSPWTWYPAQRCGQLWDESPHTIAASGISASLFQFHRWQKYEIIVKNHINYPVGMDYPAGLEARRINNVKVSDGKSRKEFWRV